MGGRFTFGSGRRGGGSFSFGRGAASVAESGPTITDVDPSPLVHGETGTIDGSGFGAVQGSGTVDVDGVAATVLTWADDEITFTVPWGAGMGAGKTLLVTTDDAEEAEATVTLITWTLNNITTTNLFLAYDANDDDVTVVGGGDNGVTEWAPFIGTSIIEDNGVTANQPQYTSAASGVIGDGGDFLQGLAAFRTEINAAIGDHMSVLIVCTGDPSTSGDAYYEFDAAGTGNFTRLSITGSGPGNLMATYDGVATVTAVFGTEIVSKAIRAISYRRNETGGLKCWRNDSNVASNSNDEAPQGYNFAQFFSRNSGASYATVTSAFFGIFIYSDAVTQTQIRQLMKVYGI